MSGKCSSGDMFRGMGRIWFRCRDIFMGRRMAQFRRRGRVGLVTHVNVGTGMGKGVGVHRGTVRVRHRSRVLIRGRVKVRVR